MRRKKLRFITSAFHTRRDFDARYVTERWLELTARVSIDCASVSLSHVMSVLLLARVIMEGRRAESIADGRLSRRDVPGMSPIRAQSDSLVASLRVSCSWRRSRSHRLTSRLRVFSVRLSDGPVATSVSKPDWIDFNHWIFVVSYFSRLSS